MFSLMACMSGHCSALDMQAKNQVLAWRHTQWSIVQDHMDLQQDRDCNLWYMLTYSQTTNVLKPPPNPIPTRVGCGRYLNLTSRVCRYQRHHNGHQWWEKHVAGHQSEYLPRLVIRLTNHISVVILSTNHSASSVTTTNAYPRGQGPGGRRIFVFLVAVTAHMALSWLLEFFKRLWANSSVQRLAAIFKVSVSTRTRQSNLY